MSCHPQKDQKDLENVLDAASDQVKAKQPAEGQRLTPFVKITEMKLEEKK